jgi:hypothetical protein
MCAEEGLERKTDRIGGVDSGRCSDLKNFNTLEGAKFSVWTIGSPKGNLPGLIF